MYTWLSSIEDWNEKPEVEMVNRFQPYGVTEKTPVPTIKEIDGGLEITAVKGASIGYQIAEGRWQLYQTPITTKDFSSLKVKAVRYGWEESEVVVLEK